MLKHSKLFVLIITLCITSYCYPNNLFSKTIDSAQAQAIGIKFLNLNSNNKNSTSISGQSELSKYCTINIKSCCYIINNKVDNNFVIIAGADNVKPILAYSKNGIIDTSNVPINFKEWLEWKTNEIKFAIEQNLPSNDDINTRWSNLLNNNKTSIQNVVVEPLTKTLWGQGQFFNELCPVDSTSCFSNGKVPAGCGALAMAQLMKYWKFPKHGSGYNSYNTNYGELSADFEDTYYNWSNMPDTVSAYNNDIATLIFQCGISVNMDYAPAGSNSYIIGANSIENALETYFDYPQIVNISLSDYYTSLWGDNIKEELDSKRPVLLRGANESNQDGHLFISDGYDSDSYFHINWGWAGSCNGYFLIDSLIPFNSGDFSYSQYMLKNIYPNPNSISDKDIHNDISIFPNPNKGIFEINNIEFFGGINIKIIDIMGNIVYNKIYNNSNSSINLYLNLPNGNYNLVISNNINSKSIKFIIEK